MSLPGTPATYEQVVKDIVDRTMKALTDYGLPTDPAKAAKIPRTATRAVAVAVNRIKHGQHYDGSKRAK